MCRWSLVFTKVIYSIMNDLVNLQNKELGQCTKVNSHVGVFILPITYYNLKHHFVLKVCTTDNIGIPVLITSTCKGEHLSCEWNQGSGCGED